jgi:hypothetical protein
MEEEENEDREVAVRVGGEGRRGRRGEGVWRGEGV